MSPINTPTSTLVSRGDKPDTFNSMPQWLELIVALILCVAFVMGIMFLVKATGHACNFAPPWRRGLAESGSGSERARQQSPSFGPDTMTWLRPPPPAYIHPPRYLAPVKDQMHPNEVGIDYKRDAPTL